MAASLGFDVKEIGTIMEIRKMIARVEGLPSCGFGQPILFPGNLRGMVIGFDKSEVMALAFNDISGLKSGDTVEARQESLNTPCGDGFIGRVVNGMGVPCDGRGAIKADDYLSVFSDAPGIMVRQALTRQLPTGTLIVDATIPVAKGQRELIIGDRVTGKTTLATDAILNQKGKDVICIFCCIGRSFNFLLKLAQLFHDKQALDYTIIVGATADSPVGEQYLAPYTACAMGEYFMRNGRDVLVIFDDLTKHAWAYRQISLILGQSPGREAYPGDIFYVHSQLVERAGQLNAESGGGSMTFLPIVETQQGDVTGYIPSNLISMTDGQIYMSTGLFQEGFKPAIDFGLSVSRIGNKIQSPALRSLSAKLRLEYVQYQELLNVTKLRSSVSKEAQQKLRRGKAMTQVLVQNKNSPLGFDEEIVLLFALKQGYLDDATPGMIQEFKDKFFKRLKDYHADALERLGTGVQFSAETQCDLDRLLKDFFADLRARAGQTAAD